MSERLSPEERQAYLDLGVPAEVLDADPAVMVAALREETVRYRALEAALSRMLVRPMPGPPFNGSIECTLCAGVAMIPDLRVSTIYAGAIRHLADCPTPHEEPPPPWRELVRGDSDE